MSGAVSVRGPRAAATTLNPAFGPSPRLAAETSKPAPVGLHPLPNPSGWGPRLKSQPFARSRTAETLVVGDELDLGPVEGAPRVGRLVEIECDDDVHAAELPARVAAGDRDPEGQPPVLARNLQAGDVGPRACVAGPIGEGGRVRRTRNAAEEKRSRCAGQHGSSRGPN